MHPVIRQRTRNFLRCRILRPLLRLIKHGVPPRRLAWSLAIAAVIGVNPFIGTTTVVMILLAQSFRLNHVATQIGIHLVAPLQWLLFLPFINAGILLFHTHRLPMSRADILHLSHRNPPPSSPPPLALGVACPCHLGRPGCPP